MRAFVWFRRVGGAEKSRFQLTGAERLSRSDPRHARDGFLLAEKGIGILYE